MFKFFPCLPLTLFTLPPLYPPPLIRPRSTLFFLTSSVSVHTAVDDHTVYGLLHGQEEVHKEGVEDRRLLCLANVIRLGVSKPYDGMLYSGLCRVMKCVVLPYTLPSIYCTVHYSTPLYSSTSYSSTLLYSILFYSTLFFFT